MSSPFAKYTLDLVGCLFEMRVGGCQKNSSSMPHYYLEAPSGFSFEKNGTYYVSVIIT